MFHNNTSSYKSYLFPKLSRQILFHVTVNILYTFQQTIHKRASVRILIQHHFNQLFVLFHFQMPPQIIITNAQPKIILQVSHRCVCCGSTYTLSRIIAIRFQVFERKTTLFASSLNVFASSLRFGITLSEGMSRRSRRLFVLKSCRIIAKWWEIE